jgi:hypothetical protein
LLIGIPWLTIVAMAIALGIAAASAQQPSLAPPGNPGNAAGSTGPTFPDSSADTTGATAIASAPGPATPIAGVNVGMNGRPTARHPDLDNPNASPGLGLPSRVGVDPSR